MIDVPLLEVVEEEDVKDAGEEEGDVTIGGTKIRRKKGGAVDADGNTFPTVKRNWEARLAELASTVAITKKTKLEDGSSPFFPPPREVGKA